MFRKILVLAVFFVISCQSGTGRFSSIEPGSQADLEANVGDHVLFATNSAALSMQSKEILMKQAQWLKDYDTVKVVIEGHCDERGTREYNLALGARRANAVKSYLIASGVAANRIATISYGKDNPPVLGTGEEVWAQNRRAVTVLN